MKCITLWLPTGFVFACWTLFAAFIRSEQAFAEDRPIPTRMVRLGWMFPEGGTLFYEQREHHAVTEFQNESVRNSQSQWTHLYRWDVMLRRDDYAAIRVGFLRVRCSTVTPERTTQIDTYRPIGPSELDPESKQMQGEAYRALGDRFAFVAFTSGAVTFAEDVFGDQTQAEFRIPSGLSTPDAFTPCDSITFPTGPVRIGESWSAPLGSGGRLGFGRYRLVGQEVRNGFDCWLIEGDARYNPAGRRLQLGTSLLSIDGGRLTSKHWFDSKRGRLVESRETIPIRSEFQDGRVQETVVSVTRRLIEDLEKPEPIELSRRIAGGQTLNLPYLAGSPLNAQSDWADVVISSPFRQGQVGSNTERFPELDWRIVLRLKAERIQNVFVYDVTRDPEVLLLVEEEPTTWNRYLMLWVDRIQFANSDTAPFFDQVIWERILKIVLVNRRGETRVLYQPILVIPSISAD